MEIENCKIINIPKIIDPRGNLSFIEAFDHVLFDIKRVYYLYDVPEGGVRGGHAHRALQQLIIAISGSFDVILDDGIKKRLVTLNQPFQGLYVCPMIWRELENFSSGAVCLVLASEYYSEDDYYRCYQEFFDQKNKLSIR